MQIHVINPNTTASMTDKIGACANRVAAEHTQIHVSQPDSGPVSIESHFDEAVSAVGVLEEIRRGEALGMDAYVIACFGDPGLLAARELTRAPVIGIAEAGFHLAALIAIPFSFRAPEEFVNVNVGGTLTLLESLRMAPGKSLRRLVHTSTSEVLGTAQTTPMAEDHPLNPQSPYAASKCGADVLASSYFTSFEL
ncbi:MAG: hypothetical protein CMN25_00155, partial [Salinicola sp.]|nr:hypothetical protein [Salinicola sp.]